MNMDLFDARTEMAIGPRTMDEIIPAAIRLLRSRRIMEFAEFCDRVGIDALTACAVVDYLQWCRVTKSLRLMLSWDTDTASEPSNG